MRELGFIAAIILAFVASPSFAEAGTEGGARIVPGFEKVHAKLKKREADALRDISRAEADAAAADAMRLAGDNAVADSLSAIDAHVAAYKAMAARTGAAANADDARAEAAAFLDIAKNWAGAEAAKARGEKMIREAQASRVAADARAREAQARLADVRLGLARTLMDAPAPVAVQSSIAPLAPLEAAPLETAAASGAAREASTSASEPRVRAGSKSIDDELLGGPEDTAPFLKQ